jgi:hypothetical protein
MRVSPQAMRKLRLSCNYDCDSTSSARPPEDEGSSVTIEVEAESQGLLIIVHVCERYHIEP